MLRAVYRLVAGVVLVLVMVGLVFGKGLDREKVTIKRARIECLVPSDCRIWSFSLPELPSQVKPGKLLVKCANIGWDKDRNRFSRFHSGYLVSIPPLPSQTPPSIPFKIVLKRKNITVPKCFVVLETSP